MSRTCGRGGGEDHAREGAQSRVHHMDRRKREVMGVWDRKEGRARFEAESQQRFRFSSFLLNIARDGHTSERGCRNAAGRKMDPCWNVASKSVHALFFLVV